MVRSRLLQTNMLWRGGAWITPESWHSQAYFTAYRSIRSPLAIRPTQMVKPCCRSNKTRGHRGCCCCCCCCWRRCCCYCCCYCCQQLLRTPPPTPLTSTSMRLLVLVCLSANRGLIASAAWITTVTMARTCKNYDSESHLLKDSQVSEDPTPKHLVGDTSNLI